MNPFLFFGYVIFIAVWLGIFAVVVAWMVNVSGPYDHNGNENRWYSQVLAMLGAALLILGLVVMSQYWLEAVDAWDACRARY